MADKVDNTFDVEERLLHLKINSLRNQTNIIKPKQECYWCNEPLQGAKLFCDSDCAVDWDKYGEK